MTDTNKVAEALRDQIDEATEPSKMSKHDALAVLEQLSTDLDCRMESLKEEMEDG